MKPDREAVANELLELADRGLRLLEPRLPRGRFDRVGLLIDVTREADFWGIVSASREEPARQPSHDILQWGWNVAAASLLSPVGHQGVPLREATESVRSYARSVLSTMGSCQLAKRAAAMVRAGFLHYERQEAGFSFSVADDRVMHQWHDILDAERIHLSQRHIERSSPNEPNQEEIEGIMRRLVFPWDSGHGIMVGYGARPEVDDFFYRHALRVTRDWLEEAGLHPETPVGGIMGADIAAVAALITSFHSKHIQFVRLAKELHPEVLAEQSLTIWSPDEELEQTIRAVTGMPADKVSESLRLLSLGAREGHLLEGQITPARPLLVDLGNGYHLRPVASIKWNPLNALRLMQERRDPAFRNHLSSPREDWLRNQLYSLFEGDRYVRVPGNVQLSVEGRILTDVDAVLFDRVSGSLGLFQLKWQDYISADLRELRSKVKNVTEGMDRWAEATTQWCNSLRTADIQQALRLKLRTGESISRILLFGISRSLSRFVGYGYESTDPGLAVGNWAQFVALRFDLGAVPDTLSDMHEALRNRSEHALSSQPIPVTVAVAGSTLHFADLWSGVERADLKALEAHGDDLL